MTTEQGRKLPCLISGFIKYLEPVTAPAPFKRFAAVALLAGALERRVWTWARGFKLHPNLFMLMIAPPGIGKSTVIDHVGHIWGAMGTLNVISNTATTAAFIESAGRPPNPKQHVWEGKMIMENSCVLPLSEFGTFFRDGDTTIMNVLNTFYDAKDVPFVDTTLSRGTVTVDRPCLTILGGTQPNYLHKILPEEAFKMGFATRLVMLYHSEQTRTKIFDSSFKGPDPALLSTLVHDLKLVQLLRGPVVFSGDAQAVLEKWNEDGQPPVPQHMRLQDYNTRRWASIIKLSMVFALSKRQHLSVEAEDCLNAMDLLFSAEETLPEAFKNMGGESDNSNINEIYQWCWQYKLKHKKPVRESFLNQFIATRVGVHKVRAVLEVMISAGWIKQIGNNPVGMRMFEASEKSEFIES